MMRLALEGSYFAWICCLLVFSVMGSPAQSLTEPERANNVTSLLGKKFDPWVDPTVAIHAPVSDGDPDLGEQYILSTAENYRALNFQLAEQLTWTNNAALTDGGELTDLYSNTDLRLSYLPQLGANTYGQASASYSFYRYADHSHLDFDSLEASLGAIHVFRDLNDLSVWLRYNHTRLLSAGDRDELFTDHSVELGSYYPVPLGPRHSAYISYASEFSIDANPGFAQRHEHRVTLGHRITISDRMSLETYYRLALHDYDLRSRQDILQTAGIALNTHLSSNIDLVLSASYSLNDSDLSGADYKAGNIGATLGLRFEF